MFGIGGTEICIQQKVSDMMIDKFRINDFTIKGGKIKDKRLKTIKNHPGSNQRGGERVILLIAVSSIQCGGENNNHPYL
jgi:hypothetical protein